MLLLLQPQALAAIISAVVARVSKKKYVTIFREGFWIKAGTGKGQGLWCALAGYHYEPELPWLLQWLRPGDTFIDVGANIGIFSLHAARRVGVGGRVISFEPGPMVFELLANNLHRNSLDWATPIQAAVSDKEASLCIFGDPTVWNSLTLKEGARKGKEVRVATLDRFCEEQNIPRVDAIKIDAEGVEPQVMRGAVATIERDCPVIIFETTLAGDVNQPLAFLMERGYSFLTLKNRDGNPSPNTIAVHSSRLQRKP